ncbi:MAG: CvpA family protein [Cardiobacteriaceae bacterium]|nr:CvpA family protein [Cardiobacteriaceae bacterium]
MNWETLNWIDVALGGAFVISALIGLMRGFLKEVLSLIAWSVALYAAWMFAEPVAQIYVKRYIEDSYISYIAAFGGIFLGVLFLIGVLNLLISQVLKASGLGFLDRLLGLILGVVRGVLIGCVIVFAMKFVGKKEEFPMWQQSQLAPYFETAAQWGFDNLPSNVRAWIDNNISGDAKDEKKEAIQTDNAAKNEAISSGIIKKIAPESNNNNAPAALPEAPSLNGLESSDTQQQ